MRWDTVETTRILRESLLVALDSSIKMTVLDTANRYVYNINLNTKSNNTTA